MCSCVWQAGGGLHIAGTATLTNTNAYSNQADRVCLPFELFLSFHPAPRWNVTFAHGWQTGGGLYISGTATLTDTNVYANEAGYVCSPSKVSLNYHPAPRWNVTFTCLLSLLQGGGLSVNFGGVAHLDGCQVYENVASTLGDVFLHIVSLLQNRTHV